MTCRIDREFKTDPAGSTAVERSLELSPLNERGGRTLSHWRPIAPICAKSFSYVFVWDACGVCVSDAYVHTSWVCRLA